jgi:3-methyladenine DNA glycosylase AlkC
MEPLKNMFSADFIQGLGESIKEEHSPFDVNVFSDLVMDQEWESRELKERMRHMSYCLGKTLPDSYKKAVTILMAVSDKVKSDEIQFPYIVLPDFVEVFGLQDWETSMTALKELTKSSSSEFAIRPFLVSDRDRTLAVMKTWAEDANTHVRRLASEGSRPRLPWGMALKEFKQNPQFTLPILEALKEDPELYVRRSVANHLNDISKDHKDVALSIANKWSGCSSETDWVVKHAMRGLLKKGDIAAMRLFGFSDPVSAHVSEIAVSTPVCTIGDKVELSCTVTYQESLKSRLEYAVDYVKQNGSVSRKVFMISEKEQPVGIQNVTKILDFSNKTTRRHYPGPHLITLLVNGVEKGNVLLQLESN